MKKIVSLFSLLFVIFVSANIAFAGAFVSDAYGLKYDVGGGRFLEDGWAWCDPTGTGIAYCYYFTPNGYILAGVAAPDGSIVDAAGRWVVNGVAQTKSLTPFGYELATASYKIDPTLPSTGFFGSSLTSRIISWNNATSTSHTTGNQYFSEAIEFTEGGVPSITFNSGANTSLSFNLTGDNIDDPADFIMDVYVNGAFSERITQRFVELTDRTIRFPMNANIQISVPVINDYYNTYVRRVYILNPYFG